MTTPAARVPGFDALLQAMRPSFSAIAQQALQRALSDVRVPQLLPATVLSVSGSAATVAPDDGTGSAVVADALDTVPAVGDRVIILLQPPQGVFILGTIIQLGQATLQPWQTATYDANWSSFGGGWPVAQYYKDPDGWVHLRGLVRHSVGGNGTSILTLPVGYRPWVTYDFPTHGNDADRYIEVRPNGNVLCGGGNGNTYLSLDGVRFPSFGADFSSMMDALGVAAPAWETPHTALDPPTGRWGGFCEPRADGLIRGIGAFVNFPTAPAPSYVAGWMPDRCSSRYTELHNVFGYIQPATYDPFRFDARMQDRRMEMAVFTNSAAFQNDLTGRHFWSRTAESSWTLLTGQNGWVNWGGVFPPLRYRRDAYGVVHLSGLITGGTAVAGTTVATLPVSYRPIQRMMWNVINSNVQRRLDVNTDGTIKIEGAGWVSSFSSLEDISFRTDS